MSKHLITIIHLSDEETIFELDGEEISHTSHDEHGWDGMEAVDKIVTAIAKKLKIKITETYKEE